MLQIDEILLKIPSIISFIQLKVVEIQLLKTILSKSEVKKHDSTLLLNGSQLM
jgi:hypothetical protein